MNDAKTTAEALPRPWAAWASIAARLALGAVLVVAGAGKAAAPTEDFAAVIEAYAILPVGLTLPVAAALPWAELLIGYALLGGFMTRWAAAAAAGLFSAFVLGMASTLARGISLHNCGCWGFNWHVPVPVSISLDIVLAGAAVWLRLKGRPMFSLDRWVTEGS
ncbi:MAG: DoxX family membrane protein [Elusimicrobia bacterium]|nr:DoxX family membrane protein [Elusimicrobiota bacterium]